MIEFAAEVPRSMRLTRKRNWSHSCLQSDGCFEGFSAGHLPPDWKATLHRRHLCSPHCSALLCSSNTSYRNDKQGGQEIPHQIRLLDYVFFWTTITIDIRLWPSKTQSHRLPSLQFLALAWLGLFLEVMLSMASFRACSNQDEASDEAKKTRRFRVNKCRSSSRHPKIFPTLRYW